MRAAQCSTIRTLLIFLCNQSLIRCQPEILIVEYGDQNHPNSMVNESMKTEPRIIEWVLVYDHKAYTDSFGSSESEVISFSSELLKSMNKLYQKDGIGFQITLRKLMIWSSGDPIKPRQHIAQHLISFIDYNHNHIYQKYRQDTTSLISGNDFPSSSSFWGIRKELPIILGVTIKGLTCNGPEFAANVITIRKNYNINLTSAIITHEFGHNLGFFDEVYSGFKKNCHEGCRDAADGSSCIMRSYINDTHPATQWSECSKDIVKKRESSKKYECLKNRPSPTGDPTTITLSEMAICGDGVKQKSEECDCPLNDTQCINCCNTETCQLKPTFKCSSSGSCCDMTTCQINTHSSDVCRPVMDTECDILDTCDGKTEECIDNYQKDTTPCSNGTKWCLRGRCEFKCFKNCYDSGDCIKSGDDYKCSCYNMYFGKFCQYSRELLMHFMLALLIMVASFFITIIILTMAEIYRNNKNINQSHVKFNWINKS